MPEARLQRCRESLPIGYQFGDATHVMRDKTAGISIRYVRQYDVTADLSPRRVVFDDQGRVYIDGLLFKR
jgi:hypothetical protein